MPTLKRTLKKHFNLTVEEGVFKKHRKVSMSICVNGVTYKRLRYGYTKEEAYKMCLKSIIKTFKRKTEDRANI